MRLAPIGGGFKLEETAARKFLLLKADALLAGHKVEVNTAWRSRAHQQALYDAYLERNKAPPIVAAPGKSAHELGLSVDLNVKKYPVFLTWLEANAHKYGFYKTTPSENWHWTFIRDKVAS